MAMSAIAKQATARIWLSFFAAYLFASAFYFAPFFSVCVVKCQNNDWCSWRITMWVRAFVSAAIADAMLFCLFQLLFSVLWSILDRKEIKKWARESDIISENVKQGFAHSLRSEIWCHRQPFFSNCWFAYAFVLALTFINNNFRTALNV